MYPCLLQVIGRNSSKLIDNMGYRNEELEANKEFWNDLRNGIVKKRNKYCEI